MMFLFSISQVKKTMKNLTFRVKFTLYSTLLLKLSMLKYNKGINNYYFSYKIIIKVVKYHE